VFVVNTNGTGFTTLYNFKGFPHDGANPQGALIQSGNVLYGTAEVGTNESGEIFSIALGSGASPTPIPLNIQLIGSNVVLSWNDPQSAFSLYNAPSITNTFTKVPGAESPYTNASTGLEMFYRLQAN